MYDDILLTTDGSELATGACRHGLGLAEALEADVSVLFAAGIGDDVPWQVVDEEWRSRGQTIVSPIVTDAMERGLEADAIIKAGKPAREILEYGSDHDVDVIVCGTHGRGGLRRLVSGSVASRVIRDARVPVLSTNPHAVAAASGIEDVLIPTDGRPGTKAAIDHGLELADRLDARLHALSVVDDTSSHLESVLAAFEEAATAAVTDLEARAARRGLPSTRDVVHGSPANAIVRYAGDHDVDLIVMGTESRSGLDRLAFGSCSQRVVRASPVPVLTVRTLE